jgi:hypothetical protein
MLQKPEPTKRTKYHPMLRVARLGDISENVGDDDAAATAGLVPTLTGKISPFADFWPHRTWARRTQHDTLHDTQNRSRNRIREACFQFLRAQQNSDERTSSSR